MLKTREAYRSHISAYQNICRTTVRMDAELWSEFKKETKALNLTTCLVYRALIRQWLDGVRGKIRHTKTENAKRLAGILRDTHNHILEEKGERWVYCRQTMTLYDPRSLRGRVMSKSRGTLNL